MYAAIRAAFCLLLLGLLMPANAQLIRRPNIGPGQFPQFRNISALSGGGYGVDASGYGSLTGPTAFSTPIAHVLGRNQVRFGGYVASLKPGFASKGIEINGTGYVTAGTTLGPVNFCASAMYLSRSRDVGFNAQLQYISPNDFPLNASIGIQDIGGGGGAAGEGAPGDGSSSTSFFGVLTYRIDTPHNPVFVSVGVGTNRFRAFFQSVSYQVVKPLRVWAENDGYGINFGLLYTIRGQYPTRNSEMNFSLGAIKGQYLTFGVTLGF